MGQPVTLGRVIEAVAARDAQDRSREAAPLVPSREAHVIDTTNCTITSPFRIKPEPELAFIFIPLSTWMGLNEDK